VTRLGFGLFAVLALLASGAGQALAQGEVVVVYQARIGPQDHVTSTGERLSSVAAILRQDRANFHRFDQPDSQDEGDSVFTTQEQRGRFERLVSRGIVRPAVRAAIIHANPLVQVTVYATRVDVELVEP
jgi:hypothetical protein